MRGAIRRPSVRRARRAQRRNLPLLLRIFKLLSSSSSLHPFNFLLQFLSSIFCIVFGSLGRLFLPSIILPIGLRIPLGFSSPSFFLRFSVFLPSIFLLFVRHVSFTICCDFEFAWGLQNQAKTNKNLLRKRFFGCFSCLC